MKKLNLKGISPSSITTVIVLLIALVNAVLQIFGINTIPISNDEVSEIVSIVFLIVIKISMSLLLLRLHRTLLIQLKTGN